jgi:hypothetical protein
MCSVVSKMGDQFSKKMERAIDPAAHQQRPRSASLDMHSSQWASLYSSATEGEFDTSFPVTPEQYRVKLPDL